MKMIKDFIIILGVSIPLTGLLLNAESYINGKQPVTMNTFDAYIGKVLKDIPEDAKYNGYETDFPNSKTVVFYEYKGAKHTVHLFHPTERDGDVDWDTVLDIKYY